MILLKFNVHTPVTTATLANLILINHVKWVPHHHGMTCSHVVDRGELPDMEGSSEYIEKQLWASSKR